MRKRRWVLLGANLLLATAILAQPGQAAQDCYWGGCLCECINEWSECILDGYGNGDGIGDCYNQLNLCLQDRCVPH